MSRVLREAIADWLMLLGALALLVSLFLTWSHQFPPAFAHEWGDVAALRGVPRDPTAWQAYSAADVCLGLVGLALVYVSFVGSRVARWTAVVPAVAALIFVIHAGATPPTNGLNVSTPSLAAPAGVIDASGPVAHPASQPSGQTPGPTVAPDRPTPGPGESVALVALAVALGGLVLSFTAD